jgi:pyruvate dehydrogenase complex dehydrogenase (E1) component
MPMPHEDADAIAGEVVAENREWIESLDYVYDSQGAARVLELLRHLQVRPSSVAFRFIFQPTRPISIPYR